MNRLINGQPMPDTSSRVMVFLLAFFNLFQKKPQVIRDDEPDLFEPAAWIEKIHFINQFMLHNNVLISILGEKQCGKTTFARLLQTHADIHTVMVTVNVPFSRSLFLEQLGGLLNVSPKNTFTEMFSTLNQQKSKTLVIIDNAENLPESVMREWLDALKQQKQEAYVHVCLVSDFSLVNVTSQLAKEAYQNMIHSIELQALNKNETRELVLEYFPHFNNEARIDAFFELTQGRMMDIATHMREFFFRQPTQMFKHLKFYAPIVVLLLTLIVFLLYFVTAPEEDTSVQSIPIELPIPSSIPALSEGATYQTMEVMSLRETERLAKPLPVQEAAIMDKVLPVPKVIPIKKIAQPVRKVALTHRLPLQKPYTLQLMASGSKEQLNRLVQQYAHQSHLNLKVIHAKQQGAQWYLLTAGRFNTRKEAMAAISTLPPALSKLKPWVRRV